MAKFNKTNDGLIFYDDFKEQSLMWTLSPSNSNCIRFGESGLTMLHNRMYCTYTIVEPSTEEYSCIVEIDHIPYNFDDIGGIIIIANNKEYAECQSFLATGPSELGNSNTIITDIEEAVNKIASNSFVKWSVNNNDLNNVEDASVNTNNIDNDTGDTFVDTFYKYIKFTKQKYKYIFWASEDAQTWFEVGNVKFESSGVIGFFLYSTEDEEIINNSHFNVKSFALYSSKYITINGINRSYEFEIIDGDGNVILRTDNIMYQYMINRSSTSCLINTQTLPMPIKNATLRVYTHDNYENTINTYQFDNSIYGGDSYKLEYDIKLYIDNVELNSFNIYDLGELYNGNKYRIISIVNNEDYILSNIKIKIVKFSEYYGGEENIYIALKEDNLIENELDYKKEIIINGLQPSESKNIYVKLTNIPFQDNYLTANKYRFKIIVE